jgi:non-specific serine/threonine protein kinase
METRASTNLPATLTSFVGRQVELAIVADALAASRLVALTGFGGVGKTRIALESASGALGRFSDGVWLVELEAIRREDAVVQAVATVLRRVVPSMRESMKSIVDQMRSRDVMIVLDNCEQVAPACAALVTAILEACPNVRFLATSREPLGVPGEVIVRVDPLAVPVMTDIPAARAMLECESVRLFWDRACHAAPGFVVADSNAAPVAHICRRLDGIPLAIELAAARLGSIGVFELAERLDASLGLLRSTTRGVPARHLTLRATIDWSHELLSAAEVELLRRLSVFAGGWSLELLEPFAMRTGDAKGLDVLARLVDRSLVQADTAGNRTRYRLLETIREYAAEKLAAAGETVECRDLHARVVADFARRWGGELRGPRQAEAADRLEAEHENLRAAIGWFIERGESGAALELTTAMWRFWSYRAYLAEGRRWISAALDISLDNRPDNRFDANDPRLVAEASFALGRFAHQQADFAAARASYERALATARRGGAHEVVAATLAQLGHFARNDGRFDEARDLYEQSLANCVTGVDRTVRAIALTGIGAIAQLRDQAAQALTYFETAAEIVRVSGDRSLMGYVAARLAHASLDLGDMPGAAREFRRALDIAIELRSQTQLAAAIEGTASFAAANGDVRAAQALASAAAALRIETVSRMTEWEAARLRRWLGPVDDIAAADPTRSMEATIDLARAVLAADGSTAHSTGHSTGHSTARLSRDRALSPREEAVARLVATGMSNRQIGEALVIAEGTAGLHVKHILRKLGFARRAQIAAWVERQSPSAIP